MENYDRLLLEWQQILNKIERNNGNVHPIRIGTKATLKEIEEKEQELGYKLPPSYKSTIQNLGKSLSFYYSYSDATMIPDEFKDIFSGEIHWDFAMLQSLDSLADDLMEDDYDYGKTLRGKLEFSHAGNGDIYAFDMSVPGEEKPVIYWEHEEDTVTYIADSFIDYLNKITELKCVGSEKWQFEYFLSEKGLKTASPIAIKWKQWFDSFSEIHLDDVKHSMDKLISLIIYREKLDHDALNSFHLFNKRELFDKLLHYLQKNDGYKDKKMVCGIIGEVLGTYVEAWVEGLWRADHDFLDARLRSYLSSKCLNGNRGLKIVLNYLEDWENGKLTGYDALTHLSCFNSKEVIAWMENKVKFPVTDGWSELFIKSGPSWVEIKRWSELEERHQVTIIHALEAFIDKKGDEPNNNSVIYNLPAKEEFIFFLHNLKAKQMLRKRINTLDLVIQNINLFY